MGRLGETYVEIAAKTDKLKTALNKAQSDVEKSTKTMTTMFMKVGGALGIAFGVSQLISFGKEAVQLAGKVEGVRAAFKKLNDYTLLDRLQKATRGTVNDLLLMQTAVKAENFRIPMETLVKGLEFAQKKATQTGQSVDYLVDSLITGIGRKSLPILDNLQLSVVEIQEEVKKVGDFGKAVGIIIERELKKMGDVALTTADRLQQLGAKWDNLKVVVGEGVVDVFSSFERLAKNTYGWLDKIASLPGDLLSRFGIDISDKGLGITKEPKDESGLPPKGSMQRIAYDIQQEKKRSEEAKKQIALEKEKEKLVSGIKSKILSLVEAQDFLKAGSKEHLENLKQIVELEKQLDPLGQAKLADEERKKALEKKQEELELIQKEKEIIKDALSQGSTDISLREERNRLLREEHELKEQLVQLAMSEQSSKEEDNLAKGSAELDKSEKERAATLEANTRAAQNFAGTLSSGLMQGITSGKTLGETFKDIAVRLASMVAEALIFKGIMSMLGMGTGDAGGFLSLLGFSGGGSVVNRGGSISARGGIPKFARGGSFTVPNGFPNDSFPIMVQSGERVDITPANQNFNDRNIVGKLDAVNGSIQALSMAIIKDRISTKGGRDGSMDMLKSLTKIITKESSAFERDNFKVNR